MKNPLIATLVGKTIVDVSEAVCEKSGEVYAYHFFFDDGTTLRLGAHGCDEYSYMDVDVEVSK